MRVVGIVGLGFCFSDFANVFDAGDDDVEMAGVFDPSPTGLGLRPVRDRFDAALTTVAA